MSTITQFPSGNTRYRIEFDYLARTFVVVTLVNSSNPALNHVLEVGRDYRFLNPTMIEMLVDQSGFDIVRIHRQTGTDLVVDFRNGSVLTASDLTNAELQAIHIAEEGRDQTVDLAKEYADAAGNSAGNAKDSEDEARRIAESIKEAGLFGYITRRSFEKGFNITTWNEVLLWEEDGEYYRWDGALPKEVPAGSTPDSTGEVKLGAWASVGDASLRGDLNKPNGFSNIGTVASVSQLATTPGNIGDSLILDSYDAGYDLGGGILVAVENTTPVDNVVTFQGNGIVWKRKFFNGRATVYDAGYTGSGDLSVFINKINLAGYDCVVPTSGEIVTPIILDVAKGALIGENKCTLTESASATGDYYLTIINSNIDYTDREPINATSLMTGLSFVGNGSRKLAIGGSTSGEVSELRISNCGFISTKGIEFLDNSYRILFDKCSISRSFTDSVIFNSPANSGEVIKFNHCWCVDNGGPFTFKNGQFIFESCSLPAGKKSGYFDPAIALSDNATVVFSNGNIEYQPGQSFVGFTVAGSSRLSIKDSTVLLPDGFSSVPVVSNDDGVVILNNCSLPLYGNATIATGFPTRQLIGGSSRKVISRGCFPRAGFIRTNWDLGVIVSPFINSLSNGSGQFLSISNWSLAQTGVGAVTASYNNDVPNDLMFSTSIVIDVPSSDASANFTQSVIDCEPGRYFQFGFWAKNSTATLASIRFLDQAGNAVADSIGYNIPVGDTFNFYALVDSVPQGAYKAEVNFNVGNSIGSLTIHNAVYGLI